MTCAVGCSDTSTESSTAEAEQNEAEVVRRVAQSFTVHDGTLYRIDQEGDLWSGPVDHPEADSVLARVEAGPPMGSRNYDLAVTESHVIVNERAYSFRAHRISRASHTVESLGDDTMFPSQSPLIVVGDEDAVYGMSFSRPAIWKQAADANAFALVYQSVHVDGVGNDLTYMTSIAPYEGQIYGFDYYGGPFRLESATRQFEWIGTAGAKLKTPGNPNRPLITTLVDEATVYILGTGSGTGENEPSCTIAGFNAPHAQLIAMPRSAALGTTATLLVDIAADAWDLHMDATHFYFQDYCNGDIFAAPKTGGAPTKLAGRKKTHPRNESNPSWGDKYDYQYRLPIAVDRGFVYFLDDDTIKRVAKP